MRRAFTLIELLVTIGIIAILGGMLTPLLGIARRHADITNTKVLLRKVDAALILFRNEIGAFPYSANPTSTAFSNHLGFTLGYDQSVAQARGTWIDAEASASGTSVASRNALAREQAKVLADARTAMRQYDPTNPAATAPYYRIGVDAGQPVLNLSDTTNTHYQASGIRPTAALSSPTRYTTANPLSQHVQTLTRISMERARVNILCGNTAIRSCVWDATAAAHNSVVIRAPPDPDTTTSSQWAQTGALLVTAPVQTSAAQPACTGWVADYLVGEVDAKHRAADDPTMLIDAFGQAINYQCTIVPGASGGFTNTLGSSGGLGGSDEGGIGVHRGVQISWYALEPRAGRAVTTLLTSDRRTTVSEKRQWTYELWSNGPDHGTHYMRNDKACRDDLSLVSYLEGLQ